MPTRNVDIKLQFDPYDCVPDRDRWEAFLQNLENHGSACDEQGWSLADCIFRRDDGAMRRSR